MRDIVLLSLIQGITEFLPVSSTGHLILLPSLLGMQDHNLEVAGILHFGTLCAVMVYFWRDLFLMIKALWSTLFKKRHLLEKEEQDFYTRLVFFLIVGTIPVVIFGFLLKRFGIDSLRTAQVIGVMSILGGILLFISDIWGRCDKSLPHTNLKDAFFMGMAQVLALIPGASRSGMCLVGARILGYDRISAVTLAFLLAIPSVGGAFTLIAYDALQDGLQLPLEVLGSYFALSFLFGLVTIHIMLSFVARFPLSLFAFYRIALGIFILWKVC